MYMIGKGIQLIEQFSNYSTVQSTISKLNTIKTQSIASLKLNDHLINETIRELQNYLTAPNHTMNNGKLFHDAVWLCLMGLAEIRPLNEEDPITQEKIQASDAVFVSTGQQFNLRTLIEFHNKRGLRRNQFFEERQGKSLLNPLTNQPFSVRDTRHIINLAKEKNLRVASLNILQPSEINRDVHTHTRNPMIEQDTPEEAAYKEAGFFALVLRNMFTYPWF
jgi:hypothetical protein